MDLIPQRVLVHEMKRAIDLIPRDTGAVTRLRHLVEENPRSARSTHVLRNLGRGRVVILRSRAQAGDLPPINEADS
jgi:hypothetical protein